MGVNPAYLLVENDLPRRIKELERNLRELKNDPALGGGSSAVSSVFGRTGAVTATTGDYTWAQINKTTSSLADLTTRSAAALSSGTLDDARLSSNVVTLTGTQTLTNKTLTTPTIASLTNAQHTHQDAAGGGTLDAAAIASGKIATGRLGGGVPSSSNFLSGDQTWATPLFTDLNLSGSSLADLQTRSASDLSSGTVDTARLGSGTADNTKFLRGDQTWATPSTGAPTFSGASVTKSAAQSIANTTLTAITFDGEDYDTDSYHDNVTNNSRLTVPSDGKYRLTATLQFAANATNRRGITFYKNGVLQEAGRVLITASNTGAWQSTGTWTFDATAGDYFEVYGYQESGGNLNVNAVSVFQIERVG